MDNKFESLISLNKSMSQTTQITNTDQQTSSDLTVAKQDSSVSALSSSEKEQSIQISKLSFESLISPVHGDNSQVSSAVQSESQTNTIFGYLWKLFQYDDDDSYPPSEYKSKSNETESIMSPGDSTHTINESEVFIKSTEPTSNSLIVDREQIETLNLVFLDTNSENHNSGKSSKHKYNRNNKTQPIPAIPPSNLEAHDDIDRLIGIETPLPILPATALFPQNYVNHEDINNVKAYNELHTEVERAIGEHIAKNKITQAMTSSHQNRDRNVEYQKTQPNVLGKNRTISNGECKIMTIAEDEDSKHYQHISCNVLQKKSSSKMVDQNEVTQNESEGKPRILNTEQNINSCHLVFPEITLKNSTPMHFNISEILKKQQSSTTPLHQEALVNTECMLGVQTTQTIPSTPVALKNHLDDETNIKAYQDSHTGAEEETGKPTCLKGMSQVMISSHSNTEHIEEYPNNYRSIPASKQESAIRNQNSKTQIIQVEDENLNESQQAGPNVMKLKKNADNYEAKFRISFQFLKDQGTVVTPKFSCVQNDLQSEIFNEVAIKSVDLNVSASSKVNTPISLITKLSFEQTPQRSSNVPFLILNSPMPSKSSQIATTTQFFRAFSSIPSLISPESLVTTVTNQPRTLFLQALAKLNENGNSVNVAVINNSRMGKTETTSTIFNLHSATGKIAQTLSELSPPDSLTSAPPSYSFVLRQSARRRPRLIGTFVPSPSFVHKTPPPTYAAAFDIYVDNPLPPPPTRVYNYGFTEMAVVCPQCGYTGVTVTISKVTLCTHLCAFLLCIFCCWVCVPLPYFLSSCKDVYHYCRNCRNLLGIYQPYNQDAPYATNLVGTSA